MVHSEANLSAKFRNRAAIVSTVASFFIFLFKISAYKITGSTAVLSDALESIVNVVASIVALFVVRYAAQPADNEHPYGHGKAESFSSAFEGGMIFFAAIMIIWESAQALITHTPTQKLEMGLLVVGVAALMNLVLGLYLLRIGKTHHSEALRASGAHVLSDVYTTVGVMVGLGLVMVTGLQWLDPLIAIAVGLQLAYAGFKIVRGSMGVLMDEQDEDILSDFALALEKNRIPGIIDLHNLRIIRSGHFHHVDAHLVVPEYWNIAHVHEVTHDFERQVVQSYNFDGEIAFHLDPCKKSYCVTCHVTDCPMRERPFEEARPFTVKSLTDGPRPTNQGAYDKSGSSQAN